MKVAFIGLGSIGNRHLTNLRTLCTERQIPLEVHAFRQKITGKLNGIEKQFLNSDKVYENYDIVFITNPTSLHEETILKFQDHTKLMVIEKPVSISEIDESKLNPNTTYYVNCPLRHSAVYKLLTEFVDASKVIAARAICSSYLPNWRKGSDYTTSYSANSELGGGVDLDLIHEFDYITAFLGMPNEVIKLASKLSSLQINSNDFATYIAQYDSKCVELHLDYFGRITKREIELYTNDDTFVLDFTNKELRSSKASIKAEDEDMYINEMNYILDLYENKVTNINDIHNANEVLKVSKV
ncbi:MAG: Gfo/Idh/MocA family oxidoreductase [Erysipelotrichales bacterium]|nr:Gfo/Idh/MocA family oxidoreductase [Erysipelotrichales bacterium]